MMKKLTVAIMLVVFLIAGSMVGFAADDIAVYIDNAPLYMEDRPMIQDGRTLAPMRAFFEALGADVDWESDTRTAVGTREGITVRIPIDSTSPTVNGEVRPISVSARIINGRTYIPLRFVSEALGDEVVWDGETRSIWIATAHEGSDPDEEEAIPEEEGELEEEMMHDEEMIYDSVNISVAADKIFFPAGGGQQVHITVQVTQDNQMPAVNTPVDVFAKAIFGDQHQDRISQVSEDRKLTDANGMVKFTYTTLAGDDDAKLFIQANAPEGDDWTQLGMYMMASNRGALVQGQLINPFTGTPMQGADIGFDDPDTGSHNFYENATDADGRFAVPVPPGNHFAGFDLNFGSTRHYSGSYTGSHSEFRGDNTANIRPVPMRQTISAGQEYTLDARRGILQGVRPGMSAGGEIFITLQGTNQTVIANINEDGSFMVALPAGSYEIGTRGGTILKQGVGIQNGQVTDAGSF